MMVRIVPNTDARSRSIFDRSPALFGAQNLGRFKIRALNAVSVVNDNITFVRDLIINNDSIGNTTLMQEPIAHLSFKRGFVFFPEEVENSHVNPSPTAVFHIEPAAR